MGIFHFKLPYFLYIWKIYISQRYDTKWPLLNALQWKKPNNFYTAAEFLKDFQSSQEAPLSVTSAEWEGMAPCRGTQHFLSYQGILSEIIVSHILKILKGRQRAHYWFRMRTRCKASIRTLQFWQFTAISSSVAHYFLHKATLKPLICF